MPGRNSDFFQIFVTSPSTEILIWSNLWLGMYVPYIRNCRQCHSYFYRYIVLFFNNLFATHNTSRLLSSIVINLHNIIKNLIRKLKQIKLKFSSLHLDIIIRHCFFSRKKFSKRGSITMRYKFASNLRYLPLESWYPDRPCSGYTCKALSLDVCRCSWERLCIHLFQANRRLPGWIRLRGNHPICDRWRENYTRARLQSRGSKSSRILGSIVLLVWSAVLAEKFLRTSRDTWSTINCFFKS